MTTSGESFRTTRWSRVATAARWAPGARSAHEGDGRAAAEALAELCRAYWKPLYAFARKRGIGPEDAADRVQAFFGRVLEKSVLAETDPARGRFRSFLIASFRNFLANAADFERAEKRGGSLRRLALDGPDGERAEQRFQGDLAHAESPERCFERGWALEVLDRALERLAAEQARVGKAAVFAVLRPSLVGDDARRPHAELAAELGTTEGAVRVAIHRFRRRYGELLRDEVAGTLADEAAVEEELRALLEALGR